MSAPTPDVSLVLACYNEEPVAENSVAEIFRVLDALRTASEVIFADDASSDRTSAIVDRIMAANPQRDLRKIAHPHNVGRGGSVAEGIRAARGRFVGFIDIDLEIQPHYMLPCLLALEQGYDVAIASRIYRFQPGHTHRHAISHGYRKLLKWRLGLPLQDTETGFKFFRRERILPVLDNVADKGWFWDTEIMVRAHLARLRIIAIPASHKWRADKRSAVRLFRDSLRHLRALHEAQPRRRKSKKRAIAVKAVAEIGLHRSLRFVWGAILLAIFRLVPLPPLRAMFLRLCGATIGANTILHRFTLINVDRAGLRALRIGACCFVGDEVLLDLAAPVVLEDHVTLAARAMLLTHLNVGYKDHPLMGRFPPRTAGVTVRRGSFVGAAAVVLAGCTIGPQAFVAAAALVNRDVAAGEIVGGVPIRPLVRAETSPVAERQALVADNATKS